MKIVIYDGILETHVGDSLARALADRGHEVLNTGLFGRGFSFPEDEEYLRTIDRHVSAIVDFAPDLVVVMRPASLPIDRLRFLRRFVPHVFAWFCDDPVLYGITYGPVVDEYDLILHCGDKRVMNFYTREFGRSTGVNFPFWTDTDHFPYVYGTNDPETDLVFLGNAQGDLRRKRYHDLSKLETSIRLHGRTGIDFRGLNGGYLDSDLETVDAGSRARAAVNIPQYFEDHRGLETWFDGLGDLGSFQYPSRVIQYAAMGLPVFNVGSQVSSTFPELIAVPDVASIDAHMSEFSHEDLNALSQRTHARFLESYSAESRALALEDLVAGDDWRSLGVEERTSWYMQFDGSAQVQDDTQAQVRSSAIEVSQLAPVSTSVTVHSPLDFVLICPDGGVDNRSRLGSLVAGLKDLDHRVDVLTEGEARQLGALQGEPLQAALHPVALWRAGHRYDAVMVALERLPAGVVQPENLHITTIWLDECLPLSENNHQPPAGFDRLVTTLDGPQPPHGWVYLAPIAQSSIVADLKVERSALFSTPDARDLPAVCLSFGNETTRHHYPEVVDEAIHEYRALPEPVDSHVTLTDLARADAAILLPSREQGRARLHPLFAACIASGIPVISGRVDALQLPGLGREWVQAKEAGELGHKLHRLLSRTTIPAQERGSWTEFTGPVAATRLLIELELVERESLTSRGNILSRTAVVDGSAEVRLDAVEWNVGSQHRLQASRWGQPSRRDVEVMSVADCLVQWDSSVCQLTPLRQLGPNPTVVVHPLDPLADSVVLMTREG